MGHYILDRRYLPSFKFILLSKKKHAEITELLGESVVPAPDKNILYVQEVVTYFI